MPLGKIWAEIGKSSKVDKAQMNSDLLTAVLSCHADGIMGPFKKIMRKLWLDELPVCSAADKRMAMVKRAIKAITSDAVKGSFVKAIPRPQIVLV
ncbi:hypothetical protein H257_10509 [Aphanomyces astaci]|uniref:Uncharacterized protein n=1 Tax=Aphanomyces astaci TaxID=112090 RepID=W4G6M3_APHAT|nr:hypothetical protein H257_10509 [Aphanomyces astaci]ETV75330.1 hypothetical protein H257_10509 [Aphanomyces astaci]|eukprot:XP_009835378.1 hypothetical protein H257_10509 [Aphanomyces astaci]